MTKFKNKYRVESHRLKGWDYGSHAKYFVTICCKNRVNFFGNVSDEKMILSEIGKIADTYWSSIPKHFPFVILHNHIIMPNHTHGIIEITENVQVAKTEISIHKNESTQTKNASQKWNPGILGVIINQYKRICTIKARKINPNFSWQPNYHDSIIRNQKSYTNIFNYITDNPKKWENDTFNTR